MKPTAIAVIAGALIVAGAIMYGNGGGGDATPAADAHNVTVADGTQIITMDVKGGYTPKASRAKAGIPTVLRMRTNGTYDCSSSVNIPKLGIRQLLPTSGTTDIPIPAQLAGTTLDGTCAMGMYRFSVSFD